MRMWKVDPSRMCRKHLLGEHVEMHMFVGTINRGVSIDGYLKKGLVEVHHIRARHEELALEIDRRGYHHKSPLPEFIQVNAGKVHSLNNEIELTRRCQECQFTIKEGDRKMKLNAITLKATTEKQVKEAIALLNHEPFFQGNPIKGKRHANKSDLAQILVNRVLDAVDRGVKIPDEIDSLVGELVDASDILAPVRIPDPATEKEPGITPTTADAKKDEAIVTPKPTTKPKKVKEPKEPRITKKSIVIDLVSRNGGATIEEMAEACTNAGLGDLELNKKICRLWLSKLGFKVVKEDGYYLKV